jgi:hypothetical protein
VCLLRGTNRFFVCNLGLFSPRRLGGPQCQSGYFNFCCFRYKFCFWDRSAYISGGEYPTNTKFVSQPARLCMLTAYLPYANAVAPNIRVRCMSICIQYTATGLPLLHIAALNRNEWIWRFISTQNVRWSVCSLSEIFLHRCELMVGTDALQSWEVIEFVKTLTVADSCSFWCGLQI